MYTLRNSYIRMQFFRNRLYCLSRELKRTRIIDLQWKIEKENNLKTIVVERGNGSTVFTSIGEVPLNTKTLYSIVFRITDSYDGNVYYRLKLIHLNGKVTYSNILMFHSGETK